MPKAISKLTDHHDLLQTVEAFMAASKLLGAFVQPSLHADPAVRREARHCLDDLATHYHHLRVKLGRMRATTPEAIHAKAAAVSEAMPRPRPDSDHFLAWSLCRDLLAIGRFVVKEKLD